jgi:hypothetical protein
MTLFECHVPYIAISTRLLKMDTRAGLLFGLQMFKDRHTNPITVKSSRYFSRHTRRKTLGNHPKAAIDNHFKTGHREPA